MSDKRHPRVVAPDIVVGRHHHVNIVYYDLGDDLRDYEGLEGPVWDGQWAIQLTSSSDGGRSFSSRVAVANIQPPFRVMAVYIMPPPAIAVGGSEICLAWTAANRGDPDVFTKCSSNQGQLWRAARRVNDDHIGNGRWQYLPGLGIAPDRRVDITFYDRRDDVQNLNNDVYYSFSTDGGRTFARNLRLNHEGSSFTEIGQQYAIASAEGQWDFGNRMAVLSRRGDALVGWTDTHNWRPFLSGQDIFAARIHLQPTRGGTVSLVICLMAFITLALVGAAAVAPPQVQRRTVKRYLLRTAWGCVLASASLAGCNHSATATPPLPPPTPVLTVTMTEYSFHVNGRLSAGRVVFRLLNAGHESHTPALIPLDDSFPPILDQIRGPVRREIHELAAVNPVGPRRTATFAVDLEAGRRYALVCFAVNKAGARHRDLGMAWESRAAGGAGTTK